jgi:hypothetical protein
MSIVATLVAASGCGSSEKTESTPSGSPTTATLTKGPAPSRLVGTYSRNLTKADIQASTGASLAGPPKGVPTGPVTMRIVGDGEIEFTFSHGGTPHGSFFATRDGQLQVQTVSDSNFCRAPNQTAIGTYAWRISGGELVISKRSESPSCADRAATLVGHWQRKG